MHWPSDMMVEKQANATSNNVAELVERHETVWSTTIKDRRLIPLEVLHPEALITLGIT